MGLRSFIVKRIIFMLITLWFVISLNFFIFEMMPGDPRAYFISPGHELSPEQQDELLAQWGLNETLHVRYTLYIQNMLTWQFGRSMSPGHELIQKEIVERLPNTLMLMGISTILAVLVGTILGVITAHQRGKIFDSVAVMTSLTTFSLPSFWMGMVLLLIFCMGLRWFPLGGTVPKIWAHIGWPQPYIISIFGTEIAMPSLVEIAGRLHHLFLPVVTLVLFMYGGYLLLARATMLEALTEDYVLTARAKGLKERTVLFKHALKNASLPLITNAAISFGFMLTGAIITEQVFSWRGLGGWIWASIQYVDYPALQAMFYIIALCVIIANFVADLLYGVMDPRIKYG